MRKRRPMSVQLVPLDSPELLRTAAEWLAQEENFQWLQFGDGRQILTPELLKILTQRENHVLRVYASEEGNPLGVVGLDEVNRNFKTARIWVVAGKKDFLGRGHATAAASKMLALAFRDLGLRVVSTWIVDGNPSVRVAERLGFKFIGRQRQCHQINGRICDRLWFDLLATEHKEMP